MIATWRLRSNALLRACLALLVLSAGSACVLSLCSARAYAQDWRRAQHRAEARKNQAASERQRGDELAARGDHAAALVAYRNAVRLGDSDAATLANMGKSLLALGRPLEAKS